MSFLLDALQGQGLPTWMEVSPLGASDGVPGALRVHGSTPHPYPQPTTQAPLQVGGPLILGWAFSHSEE